MSSVTMRGLRKTYDGKHDVVMGVDLQVNDGEFMVFVGPSGCGKTTLLRMIAGLEEISGGQLLIDDRIANDLPPMNRGIAMVFQSYALYPHMTVAENMGFSLKLSGASRKVIRETVGRAAEILHISHLLDRKPKALSGGQRQRVAIGRAIVRKPGVFLFDEPLSNLDAGLRVQMRVELTKLHRELGSTMIYVTHDQTEAMTMGDRIAVFNRGILEQVGPPMELYREPLNTFVAGFLGSPKMNLLPATCPSRNGAISLQVGEHTVPWERLPLPGEGSLSGDLFLGVRPEHLELFPGGTRRDGIPAVIEAVEHLGDSVLIHATVTFSDSLVAVKLPEHGQTLAVGERIDLCPRPGTCHLFSGAGHRIA